MFWKSCFVCFLPCCCWGRADCPIYFQFANGATKFKTSDMCTMQPDVTNTLNLCICVFQQSIGLIKPAKYSAPSAGIFFLYIWTETWPRFQSVSCANLIPLLFFARCREKLDAFKVRFAFFLLLHVSRVYIVVLVSSVLWRTPVAILNRAMPPIESLGLEKPSDVRDPLSHRPNPHRLQFASPAKTSRGKCSKLDQSNSRPLCENK